MNEGLAGIELPPPIARTLDGFVEAARGALGGTLRAIVLFGSAADGNLRPTSDVNLIVVLSSFDTAAVDGLRDPLRTAHAAARLDVMFLLDAEIEAAANAFAVKFSDVLRRRRVLLGADPFAGMTLSRAAEVARLRQVLLNQALRLRSQYALQSLREEQSTRAVAEAAGPLRSAAAALLELEGRPAASSREALFQATAALSGGPAEWKEIVASLSLAREQRSLPAGTAAPTLARLAELARQLHARAARLS